MTASPLPARRAGRLAAWRHALSTINSISCPPTELDAVSRWLVITRAGVLPMTLTACAIAGLLAVGRSAFATGWYVLSFLGLVLCHVSNNLVNDLFDTSTGLDTENYPRALYAPHPILSGMVTRRGLVRAAIAVNVAAVAILIVLSMVGFYVAVAACVIAGALPWPALAAFGGVPLLWRAVKALRRPKPERPPRGFPIWPLWFAAFAFTHTRRAGALLVAGLAVSAIFGLGPHWLR